MRPLTPNGEKQRLGLIDEFGASFGSKRLPLPPFRGSRRGLCFVMYLYTQGDAIGLGYIWLTANNTERQGGGLL
jgi:hypothetical protein